MKNTNIVTIFIHHIVRFTHIKFRFMKNFTSLILKFIFSFHPVNHPVMKLVVNEPFAKKRNANRFLLPLIMLFSCLSNISFGQSTALSGVSVVAGGIGPALQYTTPSASSPIYNFTLAQSSSSANLTAVSFTTSGTYSASTDITAFALYVNTVSNSFNGSAAVTSASVTASGPGTQTITLSTPYALTAGLNYYFFIVPTFGTNPVAGNTISVSGLTSGNITMSAGSVSGSVAGTGTLTLVNPKITASSGASRCGTGTLALSATPSSGAIVNWYSTSSAGTSLGTGATYTTPSISASTPYYADASQPMTFQTGTLSDNTTNMAGPYYIDQRTDLHWFSSVNACTINSIDFYPYAAGTYVISMSNSTGTILATASITVSSGSNTVPVTVPLNFSVPAGALNYRLGGDGTFTLTQGIYRGAANSTYGPYPTTVAGFEQVGDAGGNSTATGTSGPFSGYGARAYFYNWNVTLNAASTPRTTVNATVNPVPTAIGGTPTVCVASTTALSSSPSGGTWTSSNTGIATVGSSSGIVTGMAPGVATITYDLNNGCSIATVDVTVNPLPSVGAITGTPTACPSTTTTLGNSVSGGTWSSAVPSVATIGTSGTVTGVAAGVTTISYTVTNGCGSISAATDVTVNPVPVAGTVSGLATVCQSATTTLSSSVGGGSWSSAAPGIATVSPGGVVTGVAAGTATINYTVANSCGSAVATRVVTVNPSPNPGIITGTPEVCPLATITLSSSVTGGSWSSATPSVATVNSVGMVSGVAPGNSTISYSVTNGCGTLSATIEVTVNPLPDAGTISGTALICPAASSAFTSSVTGGTWSSVLPMFASVDAAGNVTGVATGYTTISYTVTNSCGSAAATRLVTINALPNAGSLSGVSVVCEAASLALSASVGGGSWSSNMPGTASVNTAGSVSGVSAGNATISYTVTNMCGSAYATKDITVNPLPVSGSLSGAMTVCPGSTVSLSSTDPGGSWSSLAPSRATINTFGDVTGVSAGTATISYTVTNSCGTAATTAVVTVNPLPNAGTITGFGVLCPATITTLSDAVSGGVWSSGVPSVASIGVTGIVLGVASGTTTISYSVTNSCGTAVATKNVVVNPLPFAGTISGSLSICPATTTTLVSTVGGGSWISASLSKATVNSLGLVTGVSAGTSVISYSVANTCGTAIATTTVTVDPLPVAGVLSGATIMCPSDMVTLFPSVSGGAWASANAAIGTVDAAGVVTGIAAGTTAISYTVTNSCGDATVTKTVTVNPLPNGGIISGPSSICPGGIASVVSTVGGGIWTTSTPVRASVSLTGVLTGVSAGTTTISYIVSNSCGTTAATKLLTVDPLPNAGTITGTATVCEAAATSLSDGIPGGIWSSGFPAVASVDATGNVTGNAAGIAAISYSVTNVCGTAVATKLVTVNPLPDAGSISGSSDVCVGATTMLTDPSVGGAWTTSSISLAVVSSSGNVTGVAPGSVTIMYTVANGCGVATASKVINVNPLPDAGAVIGTSSVCVGGSVTLTDVVPGGIWGSSSLAATVAGGLVTGISGGTSIINYTVTNSCGTAVATKLITVIPPAYAGTISGPVSVCAGSSVALVSSVSGGSWSATNPHATVAGGLVTGITNGVDTIVYTYTNGCGTDATSYVITIGDVGAGVITGPRSVCVFDTITLADTIAGGTWGRSNTAADVSLAGRVTGISAGVDTIYYVIVGACGTTVYATAIVTVNPLPEAGPIVGFGALCKGAHTTLTNSVPGGAWYSSGAGLTVDAFGSVTASAVGLYTIKYVVTNVCGTDTVSHAMRVDPNAPVITGDTSVCRTSVITLTADLPGGVWSSQDAFVATVSGGMVSGITLGSTLISYTTTNACGTIWAAKRVTVVPAERCINGTATLSAENTVSIFPNPTTGVFTVKGSLGVALDDQVSVEVANMLGQVVYTGMLNAHSGVIDQQVDLSHSLSNGMYLLTLRSGSVNTVYHIVVEK